MRWWLAGGPAAIGLVLTVVLLASGDGRMLESTTLFAAVPALAGVGLAVIVFSVLAAVAAVSRAESRGLARGSLQQQERHRQFLHRLDHELKNPLTAINAGVAALGTADEASARHTIEAQSARLTRLLADLRKLAELSAVPLDREPVDLATVAAEAADAVGDLPEAASRDIQLVFPRAPRPLPPVSGDPDLLFLAVYNLLANSVKYSREGDRIEVRGSEDGSSVAIEVADTGVGVPDDEVELVWSELGRGSRTRAVSGSGLGLPFTRLIVERHGGTISLSSRAGEGTLVRFQLPATG